MLVDSLRRSSSLTEKPLRAEILSKDLLITRAQELAEHYAQTLERAPGAPLKQRFRENCRVLNVAYFSFANAARNNEMLAAGAEWLLDNFHVIDEQVRDIRRDLPKGYYQSLPKLATTRWRGYPRVYQLVCEYIAHTDAQIEIDSLTAFITSYQTKNTLLIGEIWAIPIMFRLGLVENLRRLAEAGVATASHRQQAEELCHEVLDKSDLSPADMLTRFASRVNSNLEVFELGAAHILRRLRARGSAATLCLQWSDEKLRERGIDPTEVSRAEQQSQAADQVSVGNSVTALKTIGTLNWREWFESVSEVDRILGRDPAQLYWRSDFITRDQIRHEVEVLARRGYCRETEVALAAVQAAETRAGQNFPGLPYASDDQRFSHIGFYLVDDGLPFFEATLGLRAKLLRRIGRYLQKNAFFWYLGSILLLCLFLTLGHLLYSIGHGAPLWWLVASTLFFFIPISDWAISVVQWCLPKLVTPVPLPKLDFEKGLPENARTVVVVQTIVGDKSALERLIETIEIRSIGNDDPNIAYGLLVDFADADTEFQVGDQGILNRGREKINELNQRYSVEGRRFFIFFRKRQWNPSQRKFIGWERKRGKISEFNRLLRGATNTSFLLQPQDEELLNNFLRSTRFVITLDNDTQLPPGSAKKLIGTMAHPLNHAVFHPTESFVVRGYGIIQPRVGITLRSARASRFASIFSGQTGLDPYTNTVSDIYQDVFSEGSYVGKGIYDIDAFERALHGRFPENALLSHDLIEGNFARCGLASDIEVFDDFPLRYHAQARRQHRWMRGDWQLLPWVAPQIPNDSRARIKTPLNGLKRFKLIDNFRRSLYSPSLLLSLLLLWTAAPGSPSFWVQGFLLITTFSLYSLVWEACTDLSFGYSITSFLGGILQTAWRNTQQILLQFVLLPHQAFISCDAILVTLRRVLFTKRDLLEWETASATENRLGGSERDFWKSMMPGVIVALAFLGLYLLFGQARFVSFAGPLFLAWIFAPKIACWVSAPAHKLSTEVQLEDREYLASVAHSTWKYFDTFLHSEYHFLIPDNLQIIPERVVAERTSPTNIGLSMLAILSAYDLGFISFGGVIDRLGPIVETLGTLERFHGHFLNWYGIREKRSLSPRYISTVDSGNLVGHFIVVRELLVRYPHQPILTAKHIIHVKRLLQLSHAHNHTAIPETLSQLETIATLQDAITFLDGVQEFLQNARRSGIDLEVEKSLRELLKLQALLAWTKHLKTLRSWAERGIVPKKIENIEQILLSRSPSLSLLAKLIDRLLRIERDLDPNTLPEEEKATYSRCVEDLRAAHYQLTLLEQSSERAAEDLARLIEETDFAFLFDKQKKLFTIGYNIDNGQRDNSFYDLLASEARLASLVGIAQGQIPHSHWFLLNRTLTDTPGGKALVSWAGTMFEYLMPLLVMRNYEGTLLDGTYEAVVRTQRSYAQRRGVPWGISESAYSGVDFHKTYQYRAFGIPGLGLKRGLGDDLVISPYSSAMAVMIDPASAVSNLRRLENLGARGEYGFFEAVDFTHERLGADENCHIVRSFLAHHQGMSLVAINNLLNNDIIQDRFHLNAGIQSCELLLQERFPTRIPLIHPHQAEVLALRSGEDEAKVETTERYPSPHTRYPLTRLLSNGRYSLFMDNAGSGYSFFEKEIALTRFVEDSTSATSGTFFYLRDRESNQVWSASYKPTEVDTDEYLAIFNPDKIEFRCRHQGIASLLEVTISPEDNVEIRRLSLTNLTHRRRKIDITSYGEVALASIKADLAHPAFSKMFISSEYLPEFDALLFERRPRTEHDRKLFLVHLVTSSVVWAPTEFETNREHFIGRGRSLSTPLAFERGNSLSGHQGTVLDPIFSLRQQMELDQGQSQTVSYITALANSRDEALSLMRKYREGQYITRAFELAWSHSHVEIRHQQFSLAGVLDFQHLANAIFYSIDNLRASGDIIRRSQAPQSALWRIGISGDTPIVLAIITDPEQIRFLQELLLGHEYLRQRGLSFDLVILNEFVSGYMQDLSEEIQALIRGSASRDSLDQRGGIFLRSSAHLSTEELDLLHSCARVILSGNRGPLSSQLLIDSAIAPAAATATNASPVPVSKPLKLASSVEFNNSQGGFVDDGKAYQISVGPNRRPPQPWSNVIANERFGFLATESGAGFTWSENSRENRLSVWTNDPVEDRASEVIYIKDTESGELWSPTPQPMGQNSHYLVTHGFGFTEYKSDIAGIPATLTLSGDTQDRVKYFHLQLENPGKEERKLVVTFYLEWVLGFSRPDTYRYIRTAWDNDLEILSATNPYHNEFGSQVVAIGSSQPVSTFTTSRREFLGRNHSLSRPLALSPASAIRSGKGRITRTAGLSLSKQVGAGFDPCGVLSVRIQLPPGQKEELHFYLAVADNMQQLKEQTPRYRSAKVRKASLEHVKQFWSDTTQSVQVRTPERSFDILVNGWLLYQTLSCRMFARSGFFQSSGALGFRDQLQDSMALLLTAPDRTRRQILLHASRQFPEGDVQHWWHPPSGRGVRTRITDNYVWLPYVVLEYLRTTGDRSILNEQVGFLQGAELDPHQTDLYFQPQVSGQTATLLEHCKLSLERAMRVGPRGIPLIGGGDWNDGMNAVGLGNTGESIWLGWFIADVLARAADGLLDDSDSENQNRYRSAAEHIAKAIEEHAWDGNWYQRATFDDLSPLGSANREECRIDSLAQTWAVISGFGNKERAAKGMAAVYEQLVDDRHRLIRLLTPPFISSNPSPGYIQSYPAGLRENGGQYTHGATWVVLAASKLGDGAKAFSLFQYLNPITHGDSAEETAIYQTEPYVLCGDVYTNIDHLGRGGWSWYTGSSGWMYRVAVEHLLGVNRRGDSIEFQPCIPPSWPSCEVKLRLDGKSLNVTIRNPQGTGRGVKKVSLNSRELPSLRVLLAECEEKSEIEVLLGS